MKLLLVSDSGEVLDATDDFTLDEFLGAQQSALGSLSLVHGLNAGVTE